jgi:hypothetical protein
MNRRPRIIEIMAAVLVTAVLILTAGCFDGKKSAGYNTPELVSGTLTITGDGIEQPGRYNAGELKSMQDTVTGERYSAVNNVGTKNIFVGKGIQLSYLLGKAGMRDTAQSIKVMGADGYTVILTREQLGEKRYYFPKLVEGSEEGAREVPAVLAWEYREGSSDLSQARSGSLRLLLGQTSLSNVVVPAFVRDVILIEVSNSAPGQWDTVRAEPAPGKVEPGTGIVLNHPELDSVKIYYTTDGSTPDEKSPIYNPSTTYFKPELNRAITVNHNVIIKAIAVGFGKNNSQVAVFDYDI